MSTVISGLLWEKTVEIKHTSIRRTPVIFSFLKMLSPPLLMSNLIEKAVKTDSKFDVTVFIDIFRFA